MTTALTPDDRCQHEDTYSDGIRRFCADCGGSELIDPDYDYEDDE